MDYHGISMKGPFIGQRVSSLPTWTTEDIGRELYLTTNNKRYYANNVGWIDPNVDNIWTYQDTAPIGWSIIAGTSDALLATKGGGQSYNTTGETQAGTWTQTGHTHTGPSHTHTGTSHTHVVPRDGWGVSSQAVNGRLSVGSSSGSTNLATGDNVTGAGGTGVTGAGGTGVTSSNTTTNEYRPLANVGIVIEKD